MDGKAADLGRRSRLDQVLRGAGEGAGLQIAPSTSGVTSPNPGQGASANVNPGGTTLDRDDAARRGPASRRTTSADASTATRSWLAAAGASLRPLELGSSTSRRPKPKMTRYLIILAMRPAPKPL